MMRPGRCRCACPDGSSRPAAQNRWAGRTGRSGSPSACRGRSSSSDENTLTAGSSQCEGQTDPYRRAPPPCGSTPAATPASRAHTGHTFVFGSSPKSFKAPAEHLRVLVASSAWTSSPTMSLPPRSGTHASVASGRAALSDRSALHRALGLRTASMPPSPLGRSGAEHRRLACSAGRGSAPRPEGRRRPYPERHRHRRGGRRGWTGSCTRR